MVASIDQMLGVTYTQKAISRVAAASSAINRKFGMQGGPPGSNIRGANVTTIGHRQFGFDIFNDSRAVGRSTAPGAPAAVSTRNPVGVVRGEFPRMHDSLVLEAERLHNRRALGGSSAAYDEGGKNYITRQQRYLGQKAGNFRTMLIGGMVRGALYAHKRNTDVYYDYTSSNAMWTIDYQIPTGNKSQLNMLGGGNLIDVAWDNPGANIPKQIGEINAAFQVLTGSRLDLIIINAKTWNYLLNNDYVIQNAGSSSPAYIELAREEGESENGHPYTTIEARLAAVPWVKFLVTDEGLDLETATPGVTAYTKFIPDGAAWFGPNPTSDYFEMWEGDEPISEGPNQPQQIKAGLDAWTYNSWNPTATQLFVLDNAIPVLFVPAATAFATVTGF
ncbi:MAG: major capsid protein [Planctomycetota bacterium]